MINKRVLVSDVDHLKVSRTMNPYCVPTTIDRSRARAELADLITCFEGAGIDVIRVASPPACDDGVFTANWALIRDDVAVLAHLPTCRCGEEPYARAILESLGVACVEVPPPYLFSGQGDALICGTHLFGGQRYRSDLKAQQFAAHTLGLDLIALQAVPLRREGKNVVNPVTGRPDSYFYDLDLALGVVDEHTIAFAPRAFDEPSCAKLRALSLDLILVDEQEAIEGFACNFVSTGRDVIMSDRAPLLQKQLEERGFRTHTPRIREIAKGGGFIRCASLTLA